MGKIARILHIQGLKRRFHLYLVNHVYAGDDKPKHFEKKRRLLNKIGFEIGEGTKVVGPIYCSAKLKIGKNCWVGKNFTVNGIGTVEIGDNCDIAPEVTLLTGGHLIGDAERRAGEGQIYHVKVGNGVWLCARSTVLGGVSIGDGCVVAACACVNRDVRPNLAVGGVPAKVIKELSDD